VYQGDVASVEGERPASRSTAQKGLGEKEAGRRRLRHVRIEVEEESCCGVVVMR
jgi:hypothetical protein